MKWRVGEDRGSKEMDGCPLTTRIIWNITLFLRTGITRQC
jgi:hypothetical protein